MRRVLAITLVLTLLVGATICYVSNETVSACSECEYNNDLDWACIDDVEYDENFISMLSTDTMNQYYSVLSDLTEEEFDDIFYSSEYEAEFDRTYNVVTRGNGKFDMFKENLSNVTDEYIEKIGNALFKKLPKFIKEKYNITKDVTKAVVKVLIQRLDDSQITTSILAAVIVKVTGIPVIYVKPVLDIIIHTLDRFINGKDDNDVNETPCVIQFPTPTPIEQEEPTVTPEEPTVTPEEPTVTPKVLDSTKIGKK